MKCSGQVISQGKAYGKARFLTTVDHGFKVEAADGETNRLKSALKIVSEQLAKKISDAKNNYDDRISEIFLSHQLIVNDPILYSATISNIESGMTADKAFDLSVDSILKSFAKIDNEYMLGRIVDIIDATDQVKSTLRGKADFLSGSHENTIIILDQLKPSIIYSLPDHNIKGFISKSGFYTQHSGIIARKFEIPGVVCPDIFNLVENDDFIIIDTEKGEIIINPDENTRLALLTEVSE